MTAFQWIGIPFVGILLAGTLSAAARRRISRRVALAWSLVWVAAAVAIAKPSITAVVARLLGIGRGADLVLYCSILAMMIGFFMMYIRYRKLQEEITTIVRHIALQDGGVTNLSDRTSDHRLTEG